MSALLDRCQKEADDAQENANGLGLGDLIGYAMSRCLAVDERLWMRSAAAALVRLADAGEQLEQAMRIDAWNAQQDMRATEETR